MLMAIRKIGVRSTLIMGASAIALGASQNAMAQTMCGDGSPGPICAINNTGTSGPIVGTQGTATIVTNSGTITGNPSINQTSAALLHVDNLAGSVIEGDVQGTPSLSFGVVNAGNIEGSVMLDDTTASYLFTGSSIYYIADGGEVAGNVILGTNGFTSANFIQRGASDDVDGFISAGAGLDIYTKSYSGTQSVEIGEYTMPATFEIEGYEVRGAGTTLTLTGSGTSISLMGDGNVVNDATISLVSTAGLYPAGVTVVPVAVGYYQTQQAVFRRNQIPLGQPGSFYTIPFGSALTSFTNASSGVIDGDIRIATASFTNNGEINLASNGMGTVIRGAADQDFTFLNNGSIVMSSAGNRPSGSFIEAEFEEGIEAAVRIVTAVNSTQPKSVSIQNGASGVISGGMSIHGIASDFTFDNAGTISIGANPLGLDRAVEIQMVEFSIATDPLLRQDVVANSVTITNSGTLDGGIDGEFTTRALSFTNSGHINADVTDPYAAAVNLSTDDWADTLDGPDIHDADTFTFLNTADGTIVGSVEVNAEASLVTITNHGSITQGLRPGHTAVVNPEASSTLDFEQETALDGELIFNNTGMISNADHGGGAVILELEAGDISSGLPDAATANATVTITNSGSIIASGGNYLTPGALVPGLQEGQLALDFSVSLGVIADAEGTGSVSITNEQGGLIDARGQAYLGLPSGPQLITPQLETTGGIAIAVAADTVTIVNEGTIRGALGGSLAPEGGPILVPIDMADLDFEGVFGGAIDTFDGSVDDVTNAATGVIEGGIALRSGNDKFTNLGTVDGSVDMGAGDDWMLAAGSITGDINMGAGNDIFITSLSGAASRFGGMIDGGAGQGDSFIFTVNNGGALEDAFAVDLINFEFIALGGDGTVTSDGTAHAPIQLATGDITLAAGSTFNTSFRGDANLVQTLTNEGTINGDVSLGAQDDTFTNVGTVNGSVDMGTGNDWLTAGGAITGNINMGAGNDIFVTALNGAATRFGGTIDGGDGGDTFIFAVNNGGSLEDAFAVDLINFEFVALGGNGTVTSDGTAHGPIQLAGGDITLAAGSTFNASDEYAFRGDAPTVVQTVTNEGTINGSVFLGAMDDTFTNKGVLNGNLALGDGNDTFIQAWNATLTGTADGGAGTDTFIFDLTGAGDDYILDLSIHNQLVNFENLELRGSTGTNIVGSDDGGQVNLSGELGSVILGNGDNTGNLDAHFAGPVNLGGGNNQFTIAPGAVLDAGLQAGSGNDQLTNQGTITGGVNLGGGANAFTNAPGGTITGNVQSGSGNDTVQNQGTIEGEVDLGDGANQFTNASGGTITGNVQSGSGADQITNQGTINGNIYLDGDPNAQAPQAFTLMALAPAAVEPVTGGDDTLTNDAVVNGSVFAGAGNDRLTNTGTITGDVDMGEGNDTLVLSGAWSIGGTITGGAGTDTLNMTFATSSSEAQPEVLDLAAFTSFEQLQVAGGVGKIEGEATFETIAIQGGRLIGAANSIITADVSVGSGGTFGSAGKVVGDIAVASGGTLSPGASPAVMTVIGDVSLASGSITTFEFVPAPGQSDQLIVDGNLTIAAGATLNMVGNRPLTPGVAYDMIVADKIDGTFTLGTWDHSAIQGFLRYVDGATEDRLQLMGTFVAAGDVTIPADLAIDYVNSLLISGQASNALLNAVPLLLNQNGYASTAAFALLSPEPYASATQIGVEHGLSLARTFRSGVAQGLTPEARPFTFASGLGNWRTLKADPATGASRAKSDGYGVLGGIGYGSESASVAAFVGYLDSDQKIAALGAKTKVDGMAAGVTGHLASGGFELSALAAYDWGKANTTRLVPGNSVVSSDYRLRSFVLDAQVGYNFALSADWALRPAVGLTHVSTKRSDTTETGSAAFALDVAGKRTNATFVDGGVTLQGGLGEGSTFAPWVQLGVRHQLSGDRPWATAGFVGNAATLTVPGVDRKDTVITAGAGLRANVSETVRVFASYQGEFGGGTGSQATIGFELAF
jgi:uncharacterized protein YhjY with autotransporter beta-barrel domain